MHANNTEYDEISDMPETRASSMGNDLKGLFRFENSKHPSWNYFKNFLCKKKKKSKEWYQMIQLNVQTWTIGKAGVKALDM